ncbi:MAG: cytochrome c [Elusimicrobiota bacterium]
MAKSVLLALALLAASADAADLPGRALFDAAGCRSCHKIAGSGGTSGPDLTLVGFRRSRAWLEVWLKDPKAWKRDTMMPDFRLKAKTREAIVDYLVSLDATQGTPWARPQSDGRLIFQKAGCAACHGPAGAGGHPNNNVPGGFIPALPALAATYTLDELKAKILAGSTPQRADPAGPQPLVAMPSWAGVLDDSELDAVAVYVKGLGASAPKTDW